MKKESRKELVKKDNEWLFTKPIFHRGKFDNVNVYENTLMAYKGAIEEKCPIELDVQLTGDNQVICFHDNDLKRMFNRERLVRDISYKRINKLRDDLKVPLLKDVLKLVDGQVELVIELKNTTHRFNKRLVNLVSELLKDYQGKYVLVSFNPLIVSDLKRKNKEVYVGRNGSYNAKNFFYKLVIGKFYFNFLARPDFISYDVDNYDEKQLKNYKDKGYHVIGWALRSKDNLAKLNECFENYIIEGIDSREM